ncbi:hypothetical protein M758_3G213600 [Ceratodon purpureus]|nr:hypothetical protein M758_3G213600 [Ceratodon purpureus]
MHWWVSRHILLNLSVVQSGAKLSSLVVSVHALRTLHQTLPVRWSLRMCANHVCKYRVAHPVRANHDAM